MAFLFSLVGNLLTAVLSLLWAELVRDLRHWLAHYRPHWVPGHGLHHQIFRPDMGVIDPSLYRLAQWQNDVPEAIAMTLAGGLLWQGTRYGLPDLAGGTIVGIAYSLVMLTASLFKANGWPLADHPRMDPNHQCGSFPAPPHPWFVNQAYHWRHHFDDPQSYFAGMITLVDRLLGTALSLRQKRILLTDPESPFGLALTAALQKEGAIVGDYTIAPDILIWNQPLAVVTQAPDCLVPLAPSDDRIWVVVQTFLQSPQTPRAMACRELWIVSRPDSPSPALPPELLPIACVLRQVQYPQQGEMRDLPRTADRMVQLAKRDRRVICVA